MQTETTDVWLSFLKEVAKEVPHHIRIEPSNATDGAFRIWERTHQQDAWEGCLGRIIFSEHLLHCIPNDAFLDERAKESFAIGLYDSKIVIILQKWLQAHCKEVPDEVRTV